MKFRVHGMTYEEGRPLSWDVSLTPSGVWEAPMGVIVCRIQALEEDPAAPAQEGRSAPAV